MTILARNVICAVGNWVTLDAVQAAVAAASGGTFTVDGEYSRFTADNRMPRAFKASVERVRPSFETSDREAVNAHTAVTYVLSPPMRPHEARDISRTALRVAASLFDAGALAIKGESSGIAHGRSRWRKLALEAVTTEPSSALALYAAWVRRPLLSEDGAMASCGMHLLGERDIEVRNYADVVDAIEWIDALAAYLLLEHDSSRMATGHTFLRHPGERKRTLGLAECTAYAQDDFMFNPNGNLRLE